MQQGCLHDGINHRHEADVVLRLQTHDIQRAISCGTCLSHVALINDRNRSRRKKPFGLQLFAAQADHHDFPAKVRVQCDVAQGANRDDGIWRINRNAAAVAVLQPHHVVHIFKTRQQLIFDAFDRKRHHARHALHGRGDGQNVPATHRAIGIAIALKGIALQRGQRVWPYGGDGQVVKAACVGHIQQALMHPATGRDVF